MFETRKRIVVVAVALAAAVSSIPALAQGRRGPVGLGRSGGRPVAPRSLLAQLIFPCPSECHDVAKSCVETADDAALGCVEGACAAEITAAQTACGEERRSEECADAVGALRECADACLDTRADAVDACRDTLRACLDTCEGDE